MAEQAEEPSTLKEKIEEMFHVGHDSSEDKPHPAPAAPSPSSAAPAPSSSSRAKVYRLFGREQPIHKVLGGGKPANLILWRDKKISAGVLGGATAVWFLFEVLDYHLLTLVGHGLIFSLAILFLWSNASTFINKSPLHIPVVSIAEDQAVSTALALRYEINWALAVLRDIALGRDLKKFLTVIAGLWVLSFIGGSVNFLTLFYILFVALYTLPVLYEKYEDKVDSFAERAMAEAKKQYAVLDAKLISKIPRGPLKDKKQH